MKLDVEGTNIAQRPRLGGGIIKTITEISELRPPLPRRARIPAKQEEVQVCGLDHFFASVRSLDLTVAETDSDPVRTKQRVMEEAAKAVQEDGAEVIILGCAGMAGYAPEIEARLNVKVIDPAAVALKIAEAVVDLGLSHSKIGFYATPPPKRFK